MQVSLRSEVRAYEWSQLCTVQLLYVVLFYHAYLYFWKKSEGLNSEDQSSLFSKMRCVTSNAVQKK